MPVTKRRRNLCGQIMKAETNFSARDIAIMFQQAHNGSWLCWMKSSCQGYSGKIDSIIRSPVSSLLPTHTFILSPMCLAQNN